MFEQRDYVLRLIEQFGAIMRLLRDRILGRLTKREDTAAQLRIIAAEAGLDVGIALALAPESLRVLVSFGGAVEEGRCWLLAELLYLDGLQSEADGQDAEARAKWERALALFKLLPEAWTPNVEFPPVKARVDELQMRLR